MSCFLTPDEIGANLLRAEHDADWAIEFPRLLARKCRGEGAEAALREAVQLIPSECLSELIDDLDVAGGARGTDWLSLHPILLSHLGRTHDVEKIKGGFSAALPSGERFEFPAGKAEGLGVGVCRMGIFLQLLREMREGPDPIPPY